MCCVHMGIRPLDFFRDTIGVKQRRPISPTIYWAESRVAYNRSETRRDTARPKSRAVNSMTRDTARLKSQTVEKS